MTATLAQQMLIHSATNLGSNQLVYSYRNSLEEWTSNLCLCLSVQQECIVTILTVRVIFSWSMTSTAQHQLQTLQNVVFNTSLILIYVDTGVLQEFSVKVLGSTQLSVLLLQYDYTYMDIETIHTLLM